MQRLFAREGNFWFAKLCETYDLWDYVTKSFWRFMIDIREHVDVGKKLESETAKSLVWNFPTENYQNSCEIPCWSMKKSLISSWLLWVFIDEWKSNLALLLTDNLIIRVSSVKRPSLPTFNSCPNWCIMCDLKSFNLILKSDWFLISQNSRKMLIRRFKMFVWTPKPQTHILFFHKALNYLPQMKVFSCFPGLSSRKKSNKAVIVFQVNIVNYIVEPF